MKSLNDYVIDPETGHPKRGSLSRVAEFVGVSPTTVRNWVLGVWEPGGHSRSLIQLMIAEKWPLDARYKGRSGRPKISTTTTNQESKESQ